MQKCFSSSQNMFGLTVHTIQQARHIGQRVQTAEPIKISTNNIYEKHDGNIELQNILAVNVCKLVLFG
jgi:hypothetical protein